MTPPDNQKPRLVVKKRRARWLFLEDKEESAQPEPANPTWSQVAKLNEASAQNREHTPVAHQRAGSGYLNFVANARGYHSDSYIALSPVGHLLHL